MGFRLIDTKESTLIQKEYDLDNSIQPIQEVSDIAQTIKELNTDDLTNDKFSNIDLKTRLLSMEISPIIGLDLLVALNFLPKEASFITRSKKRLAVSLNGKGREEIVKIANGMQENENNKSFGGRIAGLFKGGNNGN